jgi:hypothetical protein
MKESAENITAQVVPTPVAKVESAVESAVTPATNAAATATQAVNNQPDNLPKIDKTEVPSGLGESAEDQFRKAFGPQQRKATTVTGASTAKTLDKLLA